MWDIEPGAGSVGPGAGSRQCGTWSQGLGAGIRALGHPLLLSSPASAGSWTPVKPAQHLGPPDAGRHVCVVSMVVLRRTAMSYSREQKRSLLALLGLEGQGCARPGEAQAAQAQELFLGRKLGSHVAGVLQDVG